MIGAKARASRWVIVAAVMTLVPGCVSSGERIVASDRAFVVSPGETVRLADGTELEYDRVTSDSRCRPEVQCVWAGRAETRWHVTPPSRIEGAQSATAELVLSTDDDTARSYAGWRYQLVKLGFEAQPAATLRADPDAAPR